MANYKEFFLPDNLKYVYIEPISFFWAKSVINSTTNQIESIMLGFTELVTKKLKKSELRFNFRNENLPLRVQKPFLRLLTRNKYFEFLSPWKCEWKINPDMKNLLFMDHPYEQYIIQCTNFESLENLSQNLKEQNDLFSEISKLIEKDVFADCKECPDFLQSNVTRRINNNTSKDK